MDISLVELTQSRTELLKAYKAVRSWTEKLVEPLTPEDCVVQTIYDISPTKWHIAHTTWFFERVILHQFIKDYKPISEDYYFVFNSYYDTFGDRIDRHKRGTLSRPTMEQVSAYRSEIDNAVAEFVDKAPEEKWDTIARLIELGLYHEQQHQELLITDIKHVLATNPLRPIYREQVSSVISELDTTEKTAEGTPELNQYVSFPGGMFEIGADSDRFSYDNERPRHKLYINNYQLSRYPITCGEFLQFIEDGGYDRPTLWLSDGWYAMKEQGWIAPLYWERKDERWMIMTLGGLKELNPAEPVSHVSYYEATAFARWAGKRLPTEVEWEIAAVSETHDLMKSNLVENELFHPRALSVEDEQNPAKLKRMFGDVWEWTQSAYLGYPGYKQVEGAMGEYNGKFMANQMTLRGGSCATSRTHIRATYRNFFHCDKRWQFTGFRLANDS